MIAVDQLSHTDGPVSCEVGTVGMGRWRITEEEVDTKAWRALVQGQGVQCEWKSPAATKGLRLEAIRLHKEAHEAQVTS
jgi:hypothetical protein